jgi:hypothetical protein
MGLQIQNGHLSKLMTQSGKEGKDGGARAGCVGKEIALNLPTSVVSYDKAQTLLHSFSHRFLKNLSATAHASYAITRSLDESTSRSTSTYRKAATVARQ